MAFPFLGALIGGATKLVGGLLDRKGQKKANAANSPSGQVAQWEAAGINPAFGISSGGYIPQQATSMGDSFATAGSYFAQAADRQHEEELKETAVRQENVDLRKKLDDLANPRTSGWLKRYGGVVPLPSEREFETPVSRPTRKVASAPSVNNAGIDRATYLEKAKDAPVENVPLLWKYRTGIDGSPSWAGLNPDAWEVGIGELIGGGIVHGTGYVAGSVDEARKERAAEKQAQAAKKPKRYPMKPVKPLRGYYGPAGSRSGV